MELRLIGLYGDSRAGKDETARVLVKDFGFEQRAQAAAIREILLGLNPIIKDNGGVVWELLDLYDQFHGNWDLIKANCSESTDYMIRLGQTCRDIFGVDIWLNTALPTEKELSNGLKVVISDVRQPNEYEAIKSLDGQVWKVSRPGTNRRGMDGLLDGYEFDAVIENRGSLTDLRGSVQAVIATDMRNREVKGRGYYGGNYGRCSCGDDGLFSGSCGPNGCYNRPA